MSKSPVQKNDEREQEYVSKIRDLMSNHKVGGAKSTRIMKLIGKQRFRKPGHFVNKWDLMWLAVQLNLPDLVEKLMGLGGVDINKQFGQRKYSCLHLASSYGYRPIIQLMLQNNAEYELKNSHGKTAVQIAVDELTSKFLRKEIEKKKNLYSKFRRLETDFVSLEESRKELEKGGDELRKRNLQLEEEVERTKDIVKSKEREIARLESYSQRLKERGLQDQTMVEEYENNILTKSSVLEDSEKLEIGLQMMKKMVSRNKKLQDQLRKSESEVSAKQQRIIDVQRQNRKLNEKIIQIDSKYCKDLRKQEFIMSKVKKKLEEVSQQNDEEIEKRTKLENRNSLYAKTHRESIGVIAELERSLRNSKNLVEKKEEKIKKLYEIVQGMNIKNDGITNNYKRLQDEVKKHQSDDILGRSPQKIEIFHQKQEIKKLERSINTIDGEKRLFERKMKKMENVVAEKQGQINSLLKKLDQKTEIGTKKTVGLRKELEKANKKIEELLLKTQKQEIEKKKILKEGDLERHRHELQLKKEKRINLRWEKMLLKMDKEKKIFDDNQRDLEEKKNLTFEQRRMKRRRKKIKEIGTEKGKKKKIRDEEEKRTEKKNQRSVTFIRQKVSRVFDENEDLKHLIKLKEDEMETIREKFSDYEQHTGFAKQKYEKEIETLKEDLKEKNQEIEKLNIRIDRVVKKKRMKQQRDKRMELKKETDALDSLLYDKGGFLRGRTTPKKKKKKIGLRRTSMRNRGY